MSKNKPMTRARIKYIFSYVAACVLPLVACAALILSNNYSVGIKQQDQYADSALALVKTQLDLKFKNLESASMHFASNMLENEEEMSTSAISAQLARYKASYPFISEAVYLPVGSPYIYDSEGEKPYNSFRDEHSDQVNLDISSFFMQMNKLASAKIMASHINTSLQMDGGYVIYMQPVPQLETRPYGAIAFFISKDVISNIFMDCMGDMGGYSYVLDENMGAVYVSSEDSVSEELLSQMNRLRGTGLFSGSVDGTEYVMLRAISDTMGAYYMLALPSEAFYSNVNLYFTQQGGMFTVAAVVILIVAIFLARMFYSPIEQLARRVNPQGGSEANASHAGLLRDVGTRYQQIHDEYEILNVQVDQQRNVLLRQLVNGLLQGQLSEEAFSAMRQSLKLEWQGSHFLAMNVWLDKPGLSGSAVLEWPLPSGVAYLIALEDSRQYAVMADMRIAGENTDEARMAAGEACEAAFRELGLTPMLIGVGSVCGDVMGLSSSYIEALSTGSLLDAEDRKQVMLFTPSSYKSLSEVFLPMAEKRLICQCIESGNSDLARKTIGKLFEGLVSFSANRMLMRSIAFYLYDAVVTTAANLHLSMKREKLDFQMASIVPARFMMALEEYVLEACEQVKRRSTHSVQKTQSEILQYVHAHYMDYDIAMEAICTVFELSESYLSRFFKQETGYTFSQYVTMLRMNRVKRLLETTDMPIKDIVQSVGYSDPANFTRKFRQQEGMTPGEYRAQAHHGANMEQI